MDLRYSSYDGLNNTYGFPNNFYDVTGPELWNQASYLKYLADLEMDFVEDILLELPDIFWCKYKGWAILVLTLQ